MKVYFVTTGLREEMEVIKKVRPPRLLCSYWYFKNKSLADFCDALGYQPEIMLDSGAYTAHTKGKNVNLLDYIAYIRANREHISQYITLDTIGDSHMTSLIYWLMIGSGLNPVPVIHYGDDLAELKYCTIHAKLVALGNTVGIPDKSKVARWCQEVKRAKPDAKLHLLGSSSQKMLQSGALASCDSSAWYLMAVNGKPKDIQGKLQRAEANMRRIMEEFNETSVPFTDCCDERAHG